jgi:hypothetical protein
MEVITAVTEIDHGIATWLLIMSLFLPRLALLIAYIGHQIPYNTIPFAGDFIFTLLLPRALMLIYIYDNMGLCGWFWVHLVVWIIVMLHYIFDKDTNSKTSY